MPFFSIRAICTGLTLAFASVVTVQAADAPATAAVPAPSDAERSKIEGVVHDYLLQHPEVIIQAVQAYQDKIQADKDKAAQDELIKHSDELLHDPATQVMGNATSDCAIIEFFDNQCPYCQANEPELQKLLKEDKRVRLVLKEFPILGPISLIASKAALASVKQGKYVQFHEALLSHKGHYDKPTVVDDIARGAGLDVDRLHRDMESAEIDAQIDKNLELGRALGITGTPGFVIGEQIVSGASTIDELKKFVGAACKDKG